jgi:hypothetical protein
MSATKQLKMAGTSRGRMLLHLLALVHDHHLRWHLAGVVRELRVSTC